MPIITFDSTGEVADEFAEGSINGRPYLDKKALLFRTGRHKGKNYTEADLDRTVSSFAAPQSETDWSVPLQIDHSPSAANTRGHVREVFREGKTLRGSVRFVGAEAVENAKNGNWKKLSVGLREDFSLHHVAICPHPFITDAQVFEEESEAPNMPDEKPDTQKFTDLEAKLQEFEEKTAKMQARMDEQNTVIEKQATVLKFNEVSKRIDQFCEDGKTVPAMRTAELKLMETFSDEQMALYEAVKTVQPKVIEFAVLGTQVSQRAPRQAKEELDPVAEAKKLHEEYIAGGKA